MDERLRALEAAAARGDVEARAALLRERVRAGRLEPERVRLAAYLGDAAARQADGRPLAVPGDLHAWVQDLSQWGVEPARPTEEERRAQVCERLASLASPDWRHQVLVRAALTVAREVRAALPVGYPHQDQVAPDRVPALAAALDRLLDRVDAWLAAPSHEAARAARDAVQGTVVPEAGHPYLLVSLAVRHCSPPMPIHAIKDLRTLTGLGLRESKDLLDRAGGVAGAMATAAARGVGEGRLRAAIRAALVPWAIEG